MPLIEILEILIDAALDSCTSRRNQLAHSHRSQVCVDPGIDIDTIDIDNRALSIPGYQILYMLFFTEHVHVTL